MINAALRLGETEQSVEVWPGSHDCEKYKRANEMGGMRRFSSALSVGVGVGVGVGV